jgi:thiol:disulfide interchange protein DsbD
VIEREVLDAPQVASQLGAYRLVRFDITASTADQRALLDRYQLFGPPAILLFDAKGDEWQDLRVIGEIDAADFAARLNQASERL